MLKKALLYTVIIAVATYGIPKTESIEGSIFLKQCIVSHESGNYHSIQDAINAGEKNILVMSGVYEIEDPLLIEEPGITITGESSENTIIRQVDSSEDLLVIRADDVHIASLSLDTKTHQAQSAIVVADSNHVTIENNIISGSSHIFAVYFAGPSKSAGQDTLLAFQENNLDESNIFKDNTVYSNFIGDGISFSLQKNGQLTGNHVYGSMIAFYMCRNSVVSRNIVEDSPLSGVAYSLPAYDNVITENTILRSTNSGIRVACNLEHEITPESRYSGLAVTNNQIDDTRYFGIEIVQLSGEVQISGNQIQNTDYHGILVQNSSGLNITDNTIQNFGSSRNRGKTHVWSSDSNGIYLETNVYQANIHLNRIVSNGNGDFGIRVSKDTDIIEIYDNNIEGKYTNYPLWID